MMARNPERPVFRVAALLALCAAALLAQTNKGAISGTVFDPTGAVIANATVIITNLGTNEALRLATSGGGSFSAPLLDPVEYRVEIEAEGFKKAVVETVKVDTATTATVNVTLEPGAITTQVTVSVEAPLVNVESGVAGHTITERQIVDMPLSNRSVLDLAMTVANVTGDAGNEDVELGSEIPTPGYNINVNGGRAGSTSILADGANNTGVGLARAVVTFSPDSVQEFTVQTSNFSAEYGRTGGGVINMTTKSGTNRYSGTLYWYNRNPLFNAAPFTTAAVNRPQSNRRQNQFGAIVGGPIVAPKLYDGHNRTFFFVAFEPRYYSDNNPADGLLPTEAMRRGDFSNVVPIPGGYAPANVAARFGISPTGDATIYNQFEQVGNQLRRMPAPPAGQFYQPFAGNRLPAGVLDPVSQEILKYMPLPGEYFLDTEGDLRNYATTSFVKNREMRLTTRFDHHLTGKNRASLRYTQVPIRGDRGRGGFEVGRDEVNSGGTDYSWSRQILLNDTHILSARAVHDLRLNYTYGRFSRTLPPMFDALTGRNWSRELGLPSVTQGGISEFLTGMGTVGWTQSQQNENVEHSFNLADSLSLVRGRHTWKLGADISHLRLKTIPMYGAPGGRYEFTQTGPLTASAQTAGTGGIPFAGFLLGIYDRVSLRDSLIPYYYGWNTAAFFAQNDWKARPNLTLNLGLRYTLQLPRTEKYDRQGAFLPELAREFPLAQPVTLPDGRVITSALVPPFGFSGRGGRSRAIFPTDWMGFEPRIGFAWTPRFSWNDTGRFVVRGGYGLSHAPLTGMGRNPSPDFGATSQFRFNARQANPDFIARLCCNPPRLVGKTPEEALNIPDDGLVYLSSINVPANAVSPNARVPHVQSWSFSLSYQLPGDTVIEGAYTGSKGTRLFLPPINLNPVPFALAESYFMAGLNPQDDVNDPLGRLNPDGAVVRFDQSSLGARFMGFTALNQMFDASANSIRHAGYIRVQRRPRNGLLLTANYTFGKGIDEASDSGGVRFVDFNLRSNGHVNFGAPRSSDRSVSTFDVKHAFATTFRYELPFGRGAGMLRPLAAGWSFSGIARIQGGTPLVVVLRDGNRLADGNQRTIRPDMVSGVALRNPRWSRNCPVGQLCEPYFNPAAFLRPAKGSLGNAPRAIDGARWPTQQFFDLSVQKNFPLGEQRSRYLQLRVDFINALNHPVLRYGRSEDAGEIFALPSEAEMSVNEYNTWATFNGRPLNATAAGAVLRGQINQTVISGRIPGTQALRPDFFSVPLPEGFHSRNANSFDATTGEGFKLYRMRQAYTPDRWGFLGSLRNPRYIQLALKIYF